MDCMSSDTFSVGCCHHNCTQCYKYITVTTGDKPALFHPSIHPAATPTQLRSHANARRAQYAKRRPRRYVAMGVGFREGLWGGQRLWAPLSVGPERRNECANQKGWRVSTGLSCYCPKLQQIFSSTFSVLSVTASMDSPPPPSPTQRGLWHRLADLMFDGSQAFPSVKQQDLCPSQSFSNSCCSFILTLECLHEINIYPQMC